MIRYLLSEKLLINLVDLLKWTAIKQASVGSPGIFPLSVTVGREARNKDGRTAGDLNTTVIVIRIVPAVRRVAVAANNIHGVDGKEEINFHR
jgi:hypothetical protein